jgi:hypothetical protein
MLWLSAEGSVYPSPLIERIAIVEVQTESVTFPTPESRCTVQSMSLWFDVEGTQLASELRVRGLPLVLTPRDRLRVAMDRVSLASQLVLSNLLSSLPAPRVVQSVEATVLKTLWDHLVESEGD